MVGYTSFIDGWFEVYELTNFSGNITYNSSLNMINSAVSFYYPGTQTKVHTNDSDAFGIYNTTIAKRNYDVVYNPIFATSDKNNHTNGETHTIKITSLDTNVSNSTNDIIKFFDFNVNVSALSHINNTISLFGIWFNESIKNNNNTIYFSLNLSENNDPFNINGTLLYLCDSQIGVACNQTTIIEEEKIEIYPTNKTIVYKTTINDVYLKTINGMFRIVAVEPKSIQYETTDMITNSLTNLTLTFFRAGTEFLIDQKIVQSSQVTNMTIYNESVDLRVEIIQQHEASKNIVDFYGVNFPVIAGASQNITDLLKFDYLDYCINADCDQTTMLDNLQLPVDTIGRGYSGITVFTKSLTFSGANITLNYSKAYAIEQILNSPVVLSNLRVYKCVKTDPSTCITSDWVPVTNFETSDSKYKTVP